jgi:hypothetical protein
MRSSMDLIQMAPLQQFSATSAPSGDSTADAAQ